MKKYFFKIRSAIFQAPKEVGYPELEHKILNEEITDIEIVVLAEKMDEAKTKVDGNLSEIIALQFSEYPQIKYYKFQVAITKIEEL